MPVFFTQRFISVHCMQIIKSKFLQALFKYGNKIFLHHTLQKSDGFNDK